MDFVKVEGLGNDFLVFDGPFVPAAADVRRWCERRSGVGADGVLVIEPIDGTRLRMRYWNADGGEAEMCGNGLRCVARLAYDRGWMTEPEFTVETAAGEFGGRVIYRDRVAATRRDDQRPGRRENGAIDGAHLAGEGEHRCGRGAEPSPLVGMWWLGMGENPKSHQGKPL